MSSKEPSLTFSVEPFPVVDLTGDNPEPEPPIKLEADLSQYFDPSLRPLDASPPECLPPTPLEVPPQDPDMAWVIVQSLGTAFAIGGVVGALLAYSFSKKVIVADD